MTVHLHPLHQPEAPRPAPPAFSFSPPQPPDEAGRLKALHNHEILDTPPGPAFDRVTALACEIFGVPIVWISMMDEHRQWIKSCVGEQLPDPSRDLAFCSHTVLEDRLLVVPDTHEDPRFARHPFVTSAPFLRFYAGAPVRSADGFVWARFVCWTRSRASFSSTKGGCSPIWRTS